jgi:hypothetical protein
MSQYYKNHPDSLGAIYPANTIDIIALHPKSLHDYVMTLKCHRDYDSALPARCSAQKPWFNSASTTIT